MGGAVAQREGLEPGGRGIDPDSQRDPLCRTADGADEHGDDCRDRHRRAEVACDAAPSRASEREVHEGQRRQDGAQLEEKGSRWTAGGTTIEPFPALALRLVQGSHPQREQKSRQADEEERSLPSAQSERRCRRERRVPAIDHESADHQAEASAEIDPAGVDRQDRGAALAREPVREQRERGGRRARLADADADAG
jgi:hypothetical protein